eukprot:3585865-Rhodomonas_salina.3
MAEAAFAGERENRGLVATLYCKRWKQSPCVSFGSLALARPDKKLRQWTEDTFCRKFAMPLWPLALAYCGAVYPASDFLQRAQLRVRAAQLNSEDHLTEPSG